MIRRNIIVCLTCVTHCLGVLNVRSAGHMADGTPEDSTADSVSGGLDLLPSVNVLSGATVYNGSILSIRKTRADLVPADDRVAGFSAE